MFRYFMRLKNHKMLPIVQKIHLDIVRVIYNKIK